MMPPAGFGLSDLGTSSVDVRWRPPLSVAIATAVAIHIRFGPLATLVPASAPAGVAASTPIANARNGSHPTMAWPGQGGV